MISIYYDGWLVIPKYGIPRFRKSKPDLKWDEIAIYLEVKLPEQLFVRPTLEAKVIVKEAAVTPSVLTPDIVVNTAAAIEQATGMKVELKVVPQEEPVPIWRPLDDLDEPDEPLQDEPYDAHGDGE